jgi:hypothetical protein
MMASSPAERGITSDQFALFTAFYRIGGRRARETTEEHSLDD